MKKRLLVLTLLICFLVLAVGAGCTLTQQTTVTTTATIELEGNRTTGYSWTYTMSPEGVIREQSHTYVSSSNPQGASGVGGTFVFTFEAVSEGEAELIFSYSRAWDDGPAANMAFYRATVNANGNLTIEQIEAPTDYYEIPRDSNDEQS